MNIRPVTVTDEDAWKALYRGYRAFYRLAPDEVAVQRVWRWLGDEESPLEGLVAADDGARVLGLANFRAFPRPSTGTIGTYLDDLFVDPAHRGAGAGRALLRELSTIAATRGHSVVRWITAQDNTVARSLYGTVATATSWVTYDMPPAH